MLCKPGKPTSLRSEVCYVLHKLCIPPQTRASYEAPRFSTKVSIQANTRQAMKKQPVRAYAMCTSSPAVVLCVQESNLERLSTLLSSSGGGDTTTRKVGHVTAPQQPSPGRISLSQVNDQLTLSDPSGGCFLQSRRTLLSRTGLYCAPISQASSSHIAASSPSETNSTACMMKRVVYVDCCRCGVRRLVRHVDRRRPRGSQRHQSSLRRAARPGQGPTQEC